jgi:hypothetical protein
MKQKWRKVVQAEGHSDAKITRNDAMLDLRVGIEDPLWMEVDDFSIYSSILIH